MMLLALRCCGHLARNYSDPQHEAQLRNRKAFWPPPLRPSLCITALRARYASGASGASTDDAPGWQPLPRGFCEFYD